MDTFIIDVPVPSMGATVSELNVIVIKVQPGDRVIKGQRLADLESDKSAFEFESPCDGVIHAVIGQPGATMNSGDPFVQIETADESLRHLKSGTVKSATSTPAPAAPSVAAMPTAAAVWTPRAAKLAQEAGLDPAKITDIEATGPGHRVSGDDVQRYLAARK
ncbi:MAG: Pyruvate/2-oxoglutarate dehydrogenase complex [Verrucomicrobia bacterium]|nr:MAG: Pyruvate/2-oxoglutarate dehydrogenase complex [Verrucomicrobiota bacterium]